MRAMAWTVGLTVLVQSALAIAKATGHVRWEWALVLVPAEALGAVVAAVAALAAFGTVRDIYAWAATDPQDEGDDDGDC